MESRLEDVFRPHTPEPPHLSRCVSPPTSPWTLSLNVPHPPVPLRSHWGTGSQTHRPPTAQASRPTGSQLPPRVQPRTTRGPRTLGHLTSGPTGPTRPRTSGYSSAGPSPARLRSPDTALGSLPSSPVVSPDAAPPATSSSGPLQTVVPRCLPVGPSRRPSGRRRTRRTAGDDRDGTLRPRSPLCRYRDLTHSGTPAGALPETDSDTSGEVPVAYGLGSRRGRLTRHEHNPVLPVRNRSCHPVTDHRFYELRPVRLDVSEETSQRVAPHTRESGVGWVVLPHPSAPSPNLVQRTVPRRRSTPTRGP